MKLLLTITSGTLSGRVFDLESGFLTVGRGEACSVRFDPAGERIASKQHCFIEAKPDGYYIADNNSTNGTIVNGQRVERQRLNHGDTLQFGKNGVTASIQIDNAQQLQQPMPQESFRQMQINEFEQAVQKAPDTFQNSMANIGLGHVHAVPEKSKTGLYIGIGVTILAVVFLSLIVVALMFLSVGIIPAVLAAVIAFTPAMFYLLPFMWLDRYDPEPLWLLALAFAWGALVAIVVSFILNTIFGVGIMVAAGGGEEGAFFGDVASAVISAPIVEESSKGIGLLILLIFFRKYFDDILDGIVFAGVIALGFATVENVLYYGRGLERLFDDRTPFFWALVGVVLLVVVRGLLSPFAHAIFTSMTGVGCGLARESHNTFVKIAAPVIGYFMAVGLHALWNGLAVFATPLIVGLGFGGVCDMMGITAILLGCGFTIAYGLLQVPLFILFVIFALYTMYRQNKILKEMLAIDIARGLIPEKHGAYATSAFKGTGWIIGGLFAGKYRARRKYLRAMGNLGLSYWHIQRATAAQGHTGSFQQNPILRDEVLLWRDKVD